jgi:hypothetical protein
MTNFNSRWTARRRRRGAHACASGIVPRRGLSSRILSMKRFPLLRRCKCWLCFLSLLCHVFFASVLLARTRFLCHFVFNVTLRSTYTPTPASSSPLALCCTASSFFVLASYLPSSELLFYSMFQRSLLLLAIYLSHIVYLYLPNHWIYLYRSRHLLSYSVCCKSIIVYSYITMRSPYVSGTKAPLLLQRRD